MHIYCYLKEGMREGLSNLLQALPWVLVEESITDVVSSTAPALKGESRGEDLGKGKEGGREVKI